jgi:hypothetical protein
MSVLGNNLLAQYYAQNQRRLPAGYREVEYLEATGTQYIDTGIIPLVGDSFDMDILLTNYFESSTLLSAGYGTIQFAFAFGNFGRVPYCRYFSSSGTRVHDDANLNVWYKLAISGSGACSFDGETITSTPIGELSEPSSITIFMRNTMQNPFHGKIKGYFHKRGGSFLQNLIPCVRKSDGKPGMYDLCRSICPLTNTPFYINAGTGEFVTP